MGQGAQLHTRSHLGWQTNSGNAVTPHRSSVVGVVRHAMTCSAAAVVAFVVCCVTGDPAVASEGQPVFLRARCDTASHMLDGPCTKRACPYKGTVVGVCRPDWLCVSRCCRRQPPEAPARPAAGHDDGHTTSRPQEQEIHRSHGISPSRGSQESRGVSVINAAS
jgi:hypothetical protein